MVKNLEFEPESREIIGCAIEVHRDLGPGFLESVYHNAMTVSLIGKAIPFESERRATIWFEGVDVGHHCLDLVVREAIVMELKAVEDLAEIHFAHWNAAVTLRAFAFSRFRDSSIDADSLPS